MPRKSASIERPHAWTPQWRQTVRRQLLRWYKKNARDLPWRKTRDPYAIWASEIMLQQTQVATVLQYYLRFMAQFTTIAELAAAPEIKVLRLWEGLGYYRRARQMHAAARKIVAEHGGQFPRDYAAVRQLPGIGRYTAGAILSIACDQRHPILEANTIRLLSRLLAFRGDPTTSTGQAKLWSAAQSLLPSKGSGELNQALMELGSLICTPRNPQCHGCPLSQCCPTRRLGLQHRIPKPRRQPKFAEVREAAVLVSAGGRVLLRQCQSGERWAGLWDFPRFPLELRPSENRKSEIGRRLVEGVTRLTGVLIEDAEHFITLRHGVTRFRITLDCFVANCDAETPRKIRRHSQRNGDPLRWVKPGDLDQYPLSTTGRKLARLWRERSEAGR